ncbi:MAG: IgGFc-binding protein [Deltaproteobacteria bacterium]|nr:IgGFc-binding protein [Deltaproteobacteria bacterium]
MRDATRRWVRPLLCITFVAGCGPTTRSGDVDAGPPCAEGALHCNGNTLQTCTGGAFVDTETCPQVCTDGFGCTVCVPNTGTCNGDEGHACDATGSGFIDTTCDPRQGMTCDGATGQCTGPCAPQNLGNSYIGCEYFPTVTGNMVSANYNFAVAVANTSALDATVHVEGGALATPVTFTVAPNSVKVQTLPWHPALKLCMGASWSNCSGGVQADGALAVKGAYHLRSSQPITVYQFNPLEYFLPAAGENSFSNDASLLLPTNVWRNDYFTASWQNTAGVNPGLMAVTARFDGTQITILPKASTLASAGAPALTAGVPQVVTLNAGDVLEVATRTGDLTGTRVMSDKPVQVIGGHYCANVPDNIGFCDHIEESMFSIDSLGRRYVISAPAVTTIPSGKVHVVRIIATAPNTSVTYDPPQAGAPTAIANAGDFIEIPNTTASFVIEADQKVLVAQYMEGQNAGGGTGDPAMALAVPVEQFRTSYLFHAPTNYESNYVDVTAPMGATVMLDGIPLGFTPIGTTGLGFVRVFPLMGGPANDGNHGISGDMPFGISVYGYGQFTSYWYPGGLNLTDLVN